MGLDIGHAVENVDSERRYVRLFRKAFGGAPNVDSFMAAIVAFQLSLVTADSPFDRYFFEADSTALSTSELRGYKLFTEAGCAGCHVPVHPDKNGLGAALFTDFRFHNLGIGYSNGRMSDVGRYAITQDPKDWGSFKTPSLRNVALTGPYMHDGSLATLSEVVRHYVEGGIPNPNLDPAIELLVLSEQDQRDIVSFLNALTSAQLLDTARMRSEWRKFAKSF